MRQLAIDADDYPGFVVDRRLLTDFFHYYWGPRDLDVSWKISRKIEAKLVFVPDVALEGDAMTEQRLHFGFPRDRRGHISLQVRSLCE